MDPSPLLSLFQRATKAVGLSVPCGLSLKKTSAVRIPAYERTKGFKPDGLALGPTLAIAEISDRPTPPRKLVRGAEYKLFVGNFPQGSDVIVRWHYRGQPRGVPIMTLAGFNDTANGYTEARWTVPLATAEEREGKGGLQYLSARVRTFSLLAAHSQTFELVETAEEAKERGGRKGWSDAFMY